MATLRLQFRSRLLLLTAILCSTGLAGGPTLAQQQEGQPAVILGRVLDAESGEPVETVEIRLVGAGDDLVRVTDAEGAFLFPRVPPGEYEVVLNHVAYGTQNDSIEVRRGELVKYEARLAMRPIQLAPLEVTVARRSLSPMLQGFYERMSMGRGYFITREDIERRKPARVSQMIGDSPAIRVRMEGASSRFYVEFSRYRGCPPAVYLDRMLLNPGGSERATIDDYVLPGEVEAVEVYDSPASLPAEFGGSRAGCGVIVIWTTRGM